MPLTLSRERGEKSCTSVCLTAFPPQISHSILSTMFKHRQVSHCHPTSGLHKGSHGNDNVTFSIRFASINCPCIGQHAVRDRGEFQCFVSHSRLNAASSAGVVSNCRQSDGPSPTPVEATSPDRLLRVDAPSLQCRPLLLEPELLWLLAAESGIRGGKNRFLICASKADRKLSESTPAGSPFC